MKQPEGTRPPPPAQRPALRAHPSLRRAHSGLRSSEDRGLVLRAARAWGS